MSQAPHYFKFHIGDYLRDAAELSLTQHGAYLRLMLWYYATSKPLPNEPERIYRRVGAMSNEERYAVDYVLSEFFVMVGPVWRHKRIDLELGGWEQFITNSRRGGMKAKENRLIINKTTSTDLPTDLPTDPGSNQNQNQNQNQKTIKPKTLGRQADRFEDWWEVYPKKRGKAAAQRKWKSKGLDAKADVLIADVKSRLRNDKRWLDGYIPDPLTYVNQERWTDEVEHSESKSSVSYV